MRATAHMQSRSPSSSRCSSRRTDCACASATVRPGAPARRRLKAVERNWEIVDAVARSPLLAEAEVEPGIDLAAVERALLETDRVAASDRERLVLATRELAGTYRRLLE